MIASTSFGAFTTGATSGTNPSVTPKLATAAASDRSAPVAQSRAITVQPASGMPDPLRPRGSLLNIQV